MDLSHLKIISAGAGSGKTFRLTRELVALLRVGAVRSQGIIATTFTRKAAAELQERVRLKLLEEGLSQEANALNNALIGTVHGLGVKLLRRFAYEAGVSPQVDIMADEDRATWFNQSLSATLELATIERMTALCERLALQGWGGTPFDWRREVSSIVDVARTNNFSPEDLAYHRDQSWTDFTAFLPESQPVDRSAIHEQLAEQLERTQSALEQQTADTTKKTRDYALSLGRTRSELRRRGELFWKDWASLAAPSVGKKSEDLVAELAEFCAGHDRFSAFHEDLQAYCGLLFDIAAGAMQEFAAYKKRRGLIDYADMEALVTRLLDHPRVKASLASELDLLLVDEFQDTSPLQLEIFLKLSALAKQSIWVGDPKQSIYGFRGAEPELMRAIITAAGGIKDENIQEQSWRSRAELVYLSNALFTRAFAELSERQVRLLPVRLPEGHAKFYPSEPPELADRCGLLHWHFEKEGSRRTSQDWMNDALAEAIAEFLRQDRVIYDKTSKAFRGVRPGDIAVLCRTNSHCEAMAAKLSRAGIAAAIAQSGLLQTAEAILILACLKYILSAEDSLSVAEILLLGSGHSLSEIVEHRIDWLEADAQTDYRSLPWGLEDGFIGKLEQLRPRIRELSSAETLDLLLEELDLRRTIAAWGRTEQRLSNVDELRRLALQYEDNCNRLHSAASLGGFLLYLDELNRAKQDQRGAGEDPLAVNILTYHRSKGLEWPIVVAHDLDNDLRADLFGLSLVNDRTELDLEDILGGRRLRYWVNPYGRRRRNIRLLEELEASELQAERRREQLAEEARLLYVGFTRARDLLILLSRAGTSKSSTAWLDRVFSGGREEPVLDPTTGETPWFWDDRQVLKETRIFTLPGSFPVTEPQFGEIPFLEPRFGRLDGRVPYHLIPADQLDLHPVRAVTQAGAIYFPVPELPPELDRYEWGRVVKHFLTGDNLDAEKARRRRLAQDLLRRFEMSEHGDPQVLVRQSDAWGRWRLEQWPEATVRRHHPVIFPLEGQCFSAELDLVVASGDNLVIIQYSSYSGTKWEQQANRLGPFLHFAARALRAATGDTVSATFVNFVNLGMVVEVRTEAG